MPWAPLVRGAYHNLQLWVRQGAEPPQAPQIVVDKNFVIQRDSFGNALGGLRISYMEAPTAAHTGSLSAGGGMGGVMGARKPFTPDVLQRLYPQPEVYVAKFSAATDRLLADRWISAEDAEAMKKAAAAGPIMK
jgi:hypothetical protein